MEYTIEDLKDFIFGLHWFGRDDLELFRFPSSNFPELGPDITERAMKPSGARIRFQARTPFIGLELEVLPTGTYDRFSRAGQFGIDLYVDGLYHTTLVPPQDGYNLLWTPGDAQMEWSDETHTFELYLPIYAPIQIRSLGVEEEISPAPIHRIQKPLVFYGSSITQGGFASRPAMTFPAIITRELGADLINLGLSGMGKGTMREAELIAEIDAAAFVMDWGINLYAPEEYLLIRDRYRPFVQTIRERHPDAPFLFIVTESIAAERWNADARRRLDVIRDEIRTIYEEIRAAGGVRVALIEGRDIIGQKDMDLTSDGVHFNDAGFLAYARAIIPVLKELMEL